MTMRLLSQGSICTCATQEPCKAEAEVADLIERLDSRAHRHRLAAGTKLFAEDDTIDRILVLASGWAIKSKSLIDGRRQILDFALPGDVLGSLQMRRASHAAEMLTAGEIVAVPAECFAQCAGADARAVIEIARRFEAAEMRAYERIAAMSCRSAHVRVCRMLVELVERRSAPDCGERALRLPLPLRQSHLADALGLRIETVCRVLGRLARAGIAQLRHGQLMVGDIAALRGECEREAPPPSGDRVAPAEAAALHA